MARRAAHLGLGNGVDLATVVGCTRERITAWTRLNNPPKSFRKGFSFRLATALKTDSRTLFVEYPGVAPEDAPIVEADECDTRENIALRADIARDLDRLRGDRLRAVAAALSELAKT